MKYRDYYEILGVDKKASADEIKKAYMKTGKNIIRIHQGQGCRGKVQKINEAYEVLGNDERRRSMISSAHRDSLSLLILTLLSLASKQDEV